MRCSTENLGHCTDQSVGEAFKITGNDLKNIVVVEDPHTKVQKTNHADTTSDSKRIQGTYQQVLLNAKRLDWRNKETKSTKPN